LTPSAGAKVPTLDAVHISKFGVGADHRDEIAERVQPSVPVHPSTDDLPGQSERNHDGPGTFGMGRDAETFAYTSFQRQPLKG
jgi:hypothetical protein